MAPEMNREREAAQLWMQPGVRSAAAPPGPAWMGEIDQHTGVRRGSEMARCHTSLFGGKKSEVLRVWGAVF